MKRPSTGFQKRIKANSLQAVRTVLCQALLLHLLSLTVNRLELIFVNSEYFQHRQYKREGKLQIIVATALIPHLICCPLPMSEWHGFTALARPLAGLLDGP
jgi:hypothetical protein